MTQNRLELQEEQNLIPLPVQKVQSEREVSLFDAQTIDQLEWPLTEQGQYAKKFLAPLVKEGISRYVHNIQADIFVLKCGNFVFPIIVNNDNYQNSYVCSPYAHYISYGSQAVTHLIKTRAFALLVKQLLLGIGRISRATHLNSVVYVNHWLFSTDLYPEEPSAGEIAAITSFLIQRFPQHALIFRSLNLLTTPGLLGQMKPTEYDLIPSRYVYVTDARNEEIFQTRILKSDLRLWEKKTYDVVDDSGLSDKDCPDLLRLYNSLYIEHHSHLQPQFSESFMQLILKNKILSFKVLKSGEEISGVAGYCVRNGVMFCSFFGYDKEDPDHAVIYRLLNTALLLEARQRGVLFHQSAGASFSKTIRRAEGCIEYMAVHVQHLPSLQKASWRLLNNLMNRLGPKYMKNY